MKSLFYPKSVAVLGASTNPQKLGYVIANNIITSGYQGELHLINPKYDEILGVKAEKTISDIKSLVEVVIVVVPAVNVPEVIEQIGDQKQLIKNTAETFVVVISAGFKESGVDGLELENRVAQIAKKYNIRLVGPNCLGVMNLSKDLYSYNGTFDFSPSISGNISLVSQSGALISGIVEQAQTLGFGFNKIVSLGNKSDINENDLIQYLQTDEETAVIALYLESFADGHELIKTLQNVSKPVVILKSGRSEQAKTAATSHTGSIAGNEKVSASFLESENVIEVFSLEEFFDTLGLLSRYSSVPNNQVSVITNAGGLGVITLDAIASTKLKLAQFSPKLSDRLKLVLPSAASVRNPVDILGDAESDRYQSVLENLLSSGESGNLVVILTPQVSTDVDNVAKALVNLSEKYPQIPILPVFIGGEKIVAAQTLFKNHKLFSFETPEQALKALDNLAKYQSAKTTKTSSLNVILDQTILDALPQIKTLISQNKLNKNKILDFQTIVQISSTFGLNIPRYLQIQNISQLDQVFEILGKPVVVKSVKTDLLHRTEKKAVLTGVSKVSDITNFLDENDLADVIFQESIDKGLEVFAGIQNDPNFGKVLVVGTGGIYAEVMDDFALGPLPTNIDQVKEIFNRTKVSKILSNFRNIDFDSHELYTQVFRLCQFVSLFPEIVSVDANPMIVTATECYVVDLKVSLQ
jgi:acetyltransferase